jgi:DNA-binding transcriptional ArsR family regulator
MRPDVDQTLAALADPTRRAIVDLLRRGPQRPSDVAEALSTSRPSLSRHLRVLRSAGLVEDELVESDARARMLSLRRAPFTQLGSWLGEVEAFWEDQLGAFKAHAERAQAAKRPLARAGEERKRK